MLQTIRRLEYNSGRGSSIGTIIAHLNLEIVDCFRSKASYGVLYSLIRQLVAFFMSIDLFISPSDVRILVKRSLVQIGNNIALN